MLRERFWEGTTWLTFDRPERLNSFTGNDYRDLRIALERATSDTATRVIVLTGTGRAFSAGAERSLADGTTPAADLKLADDEFAALLEAIDQCDKPILAAVNGLAVGIGCTILLHCDLVIMAESARARLPFTSLGIAPEAGSSALLPARARWGDAMWAMLSSDWLDAPGCLAMAWRVVPDADLLDDIEHAASTLAARDPAAVTATKRLLVAGRADAVRAAMQREYEEMRTLRG
jgi:enoyl-CoA hydratase/carnithine racemase